MKNLVNYLDEYLNDDSIYEMINKNKYKSHIGDTDEYIKANRKASREEEIKAHGHPINHNRVWKSKKIIIENKNIKITGNEKFSKFY